MEIRKVENFMISKKFFPNKTLILTVGIPGSGKSSWIEKNNYTNIPVVSRDVIRFQMLGNSKDDYFSKEDAVWKEYVHQIQCYLNNNSSVIADATHITKASRKKILDALNLDDKTDINIIYFDVPLDVCLERNAKRTGLARVPDEAIKGMYNKLTAPSFNEKYLYNWIHTINENGDVIKAEHYRFLGKNKVIDTITFNKEQE